MDHIKKQARLMVALMLGALFLVSLSLAWQEATTFDERAHVPAAYSSVHFGDMRLNPEHPPLIKDLAGIPLQFMNLSFPTDSAQWQSGVNEQWTVGSMFIHQNDAGWVMFWARFPIILLTLLFGFILYRFTKGFAGTVAGLFALLLFIADPNVIAHDHYVTTDLGIAAFIFISIISFVRFLRKPDTANTIFFGVFLALAELAKFSAILLYPYFALVILAYALTRPKADTVRDSNILFSLKQFFSYAIKYVGALVVCFALIWIVYLFNTVNEPGIKMVETAKSFFQQDNLPAHFAIDTVTSLSGSATTKPFAQYLLGFFKVFSRFEGGNTHFFLGDVTADASPWYFPVVFTLKETLPFLFLLVFGGIYTVVRIVKSFAGKSARTWHTVIAHSVQSHITQYTMFGFVVLYAFVSITGNLNIGFRHLFPILPLLIVLVAKTVFDFIRRQGFQGEHTSRIVLTALAFWILVIPVVAYPSYLSYFNEAAGGTANGYRYVTDSNYDWGQDMKRLSDFVNAFNDCKSGATDPDFCTQFAGIMQDPPIDQLRMAYFGGADPKYYLGDKYTEWYADWGRRSGWHAISATFWQESLYQPNPTGKLTYRWIIDGGYPMAWRAGDSIFVYYIPPSPGIE